MDIKELDKKQLILLTLLITFVVSIATGIVTVSLMKQMPKSVPQTINNVIQRTIEKVTTVQVPTPVPSTASKSDNSATSSSDNSSSLLDNNAEALVPIYLASTDTSGVGSTTSDANSAASASTPAIDGTNGNNAAGNDAKVPSIGQGVIVSDIGLILVDSSLIKESESYKVVLNKIDFNVSVLKKFDNGFTILKIIPPADKTTASTDTTSNTTQ
jgi:hypothetical protein